MITDPLKNFIYLYKKRWNGMKMSMRRKLSEAYFLKNISLFQNLTIKKHTKISVNLIFSF